MMSNRICWVVAVAFGLNAGVAHAQTLQGAVAPAEFPPSSFKGNQYVDSRGCVFIRAGVGGQVTWAPRVRRDRQQVCGYEPTFAAAEAAAAPAASAQARAAQVRPRARAVVKPVAPRKAATRSAAGVALERSARPGRVMPSHVYEERRSNDVGQTVPRGYVAAFKDDRLNPRRTEGTVEGWSRMERVWTNTVPRRLVPRNGETDVTGIFVTRRPDLVTANGRSVNAAPVVSSSTGRAVTAQRYVQVGSYDAKTGAAGAAGRLKAQGLPVRMGRQAQGGRTLQVVLAGPFADEAAARRALRKVRQAGFGDAFIR